jgi:hypothetical protein
MKISELFESSPSFDLDLLLEDLGTLEAVDKEFLNLLKTSVKYKYIKKSGGQYRQNIENKLPQYLGQNSKTELIPAKSGAEIYRAIHDNENIKAIVIEFDGKQCFAALKTPTQSLNKVNYFWVASWKKIFGTTDIPEEQHEIAVALNSANVYDMKAKQGDEKVLYKALTTLLKAIKQINAKTVIKVLTISTDAERNTLQKSRDKAREIPKQFRHLVQPLEKFASEEDKITWENHIKSRLKDRLDVFKAQHAENFETPEEMLRVITEKGFLENIRINGLTYERADSSTLSFNTIMKWKPGMGNDTWNKSYISYNIKTFTPEYEEYSSELRKVREALKNIITNEEEYDRQMEKYRMPSTINIFFKFQGGMIVPADVSVESFTKWKRAK